MAALERAAGANDAAETVAAAFLKMLRELTRFLAGTNPETCPPCSTRVGYGVRRLSADSLLRTASLRVVAPGVAAGVNVVGAVLDGVSDEDGGGLRLGHDHRRTERVGAARPRIYRARARN
jgi:hypothetical protein